MFDAHIVTEAADQSSAYPSLAEGCHSIPMVSASAPTRGMIASSSVLDSCWVVLVQLLCGYHVWLSFHGITTKEHWKGVKDENAKKMDEKTKEVASSDSAKKAAAESFQKQLVHLCHYCVEKNIYLKMQSKI